MERPQELRRNFLSISLHLSFSSALWLRCLCGKCSVCVLLFHEDERVTQA
jgi:hypothetical protein